MNFFSKPAASSVTKSVRLESLDETGFTVSGRMSLTGAHYSLVYDILTDYDACARIYHNVTKSSMSVLPSGQKEVSQTCRWNFLAFAGSFDLSFEVQEDPGSLVQFKLIESTFMRSFQGEWRVVPFSSRNSEASAEELLEAADSCCVEHVVLVKPLMDLPRPLAKLANGLFVAQVSKVFDDLAAEVDRRLAAIQKL